jgi:hypothetical protein
MKIAGVAGILLLIAACGADVEPGQAAATSTPTVTSTPMPILPLIVIDPEFGLRVQTSEGMVDPEGVIGSEMLEQILAIACETKPESCQQDQLMLPDALEPAVSAARERLVDEYGASGARMKLLSIEEVIWADPSLGCSESSTFSPLAPQFIPGYKFTYSRDVGLIVVHADAEGKTAVICGSTARLVPN